MKYAIEEIDNEEVGWENQNLMDAKQSKFSYANQKLCPHSREDDEVSKGTTQNGGVQCDLWTAMKEAIEDIDDEEVRCENQNLADA